MKPDSSTANAAPIPSNPILAEMSLPGFIRYLGQVTLRHWLRGVLVLSAFGLLIWIIMAAGSSVTPFIIGLILFYLIAPIVNKLGNFMPRSLAILLVYLIGIGLITSAIIFLVPPLINQAQRLIQVIPNTNSLQNTFNQLLEAYRQTVPDTLRTTVDEGLGNALQTIQANISQYIQTALGFIVTRLLQVVSLISFIVGLLVIPIWLFYLLNDQRKARIGLNRVLNFRIRPDFWNVWGIVDGSLSAYIRGQVTLGTIIGVAVGVGLAIIDLIPGLEIDYILLLALWAGICELIPMIGAILGGTPGVILAFVIGGPTTGVVVLIMYIVIQQLENNLLVPRIIGESVGVHPAILTVTLIVLGNLFGLAGVILAAPMTAIARDLYRYTYRRLSGLMPDEAIVTTTNT